MSLYVKQDFCPPLLSRRWIAMRFRPNLLIHCRENIITILESGLLFREDSIEVEQEAPSPEAVWKGAGGGRGGWLTRGEGALSVAAVVAAVTLFPPRSLNRTTLFYISAYASLPIAVRTTHRSLSRGALSALLRCMKDYLALARRAAACLKEFAALLTKIGSLSSVIESTRTLLCRQQSELSITMSRATSALLGNAPWLRDDVAWHAVATDDTHNLMKIHHAFLVVQSTLLKNIAMAHITTPATQKLYRNHNERLHWLHNTLIQHLLEEFKANFEALERMYRLLKNAGNKDDNVSKKLGSAVQKNWIYSEVHTGIARACLELKLALNKSNTLDVFLDSCVLNNHDIEADILDKDVDDLIEDITKCLKTVQSSQLRLKKLKGKMADSVPITDEVIEESAPLLKIEDREPEIKDEVFFFIKTEDDEAPIRQSDDVTAPGKKEREDTKTVLCELKRKLGKREDMMRERERQALVKTMPELKNVPEFPRQIQFDEFVVKKGYINKIKHVDDKKRLFRQYKIRRTNNNKGRKYELESGEYVNESDIKGDKYEANALLNVKSKLFTVTSLGNNIIVKIWRRTKAESRIVEYDSSSSFPDNEEADNNNVTQDGVHKNVTQEAINKNLSQEAVKKNSPQEAVKKNATQEAVNKNVNNHGIELKVTKKDLELSESSESDLEFYNHQRALLHDIRRHRAARKKNNPKRNIPVVPIDNVDESLKPIEYSFGAGLAMASVLQVNNPKFLNMAQEEVFNGDGEVSNDSGNDEDA